MKTAKPGLPGKMAVKMERWVTIAVLVYCRRLMWHFGKPDVIVSVLVTLNKLAP